MTDTLFVKYFLVFMEKILSLQSKFLTAERQSKGWRCPDASGSNF